MNGKKIIFVTGTDTGVGKTLLTALLLYHLRQTPGRTLAMKPFCSGGLEDVRLLQSLQFGELTDYEANPFYFPQPIAPLVASTGKQKKVSLADVIDRIEHVKTKCDRLIIEGSGGLLVPLGKNYTVADLISALDCQIIIASRNQLGTINHTLLTINTLKAMGISPKRLKIVLMNGSRPDLSSQSNPQTIAELASKIRVFSLPFIGLKASSKKKIEANYPKVSSVLKKVIR